MTVERDENSSQFQVRTPEGLALLQYRQRHGRILFIHTEVPEELRGRGIAEALARAGLEYARAEGLDVLVYCPYVTEFIRRHPEYQALVKRTAKS